MPQTIRLEATGEDLVFLEDTTSTSGQYVSFEVALRPDGQGPPPHVHHRQVETFEILEGALGVQIGEQTHTLEAGARIEVPADTEHSWWNAGDDVVRFLARAEPALRLEWMLREMFASANRRGAASPSPWDGAYILSQLRGEYSLASVPRFVQYFVFPAMAKVGRAVGLVRVAPPPRR